MEWTKLGVVFDPRGRVPAVVSHAQIPTPLQIDDAILRVYYSARDEAGRSLPYYVDIDANDPFRVITVGTEPCLELGTRGSFDDNGIVTCSVIQNQHRYFMYYVGFELYAHVRYKLFTGLAVSEDGKLFRRHSRAPILDRSDEERCFRCGPYVHRGHDGFHMYYVAGSDWETVNGKEMPVYQVKRITSPDGIAWPATGELVLSLSDPDEHGFGRPWVLPTDNGYEMYYSIRKRSVGAYRMGWATSADGLRWTRHDTALGLDVTPGSFDSAAIMYAAVVTLNNHTYCFYNGNDFGADGIAVAVRRNVQA